MKFLRRIKKIVFDRYAAPQPHHGQGVSDRTIQKHGHTDYDRYPTIFEEVRRLAGDNADSKILSFGCSTGEEVFSLADKYFLETQITGLDIDSRSIKTAIRNNPYPERVQFFETSDSTLRECGPFDVIFAMSVLCAWPESKDLDNISPLMTFDDFERHTSFLHQHLKCHGFFVIYNASFCFSDSGVSSSYRAIQMKGQNESGFVKKFDRNNRSMKGYVYAHSIFKKLRD